MANSTDGINVVISADTSKLSADINNAKAQFTQLASGATASLAQTTTAMAGTEAAANSLGNATKDLGEKITETGSRRELRESLNLMRASADGTGGAFDALRAILVTFGAEMGGPMLVAIGAGIAVLGALYEITKSYIEEQRLLNDESAQLKLPTEKIEAMTTAMKSLAFQITGAQDGFGHLDTSKTDLIKQLGLDPAKADSARQAIVMVQNSADDLATKMHNFAILAGETDPAKIAAGWDAAMQENKKSSEGWFKTWMGYIAAGELAQAGMYEDSEKAMPKNKGDADKEGVKTGGTIGKAQTQQQIEDAQKLQETLNGLVDKGKEARIATMKDEAAKIIAESELETERLIQEKDKQQKALVNNPTASAAIGAQYDKTISDVKASAQVRAAQVTAQQRLEAETSFQAAMAALRKAGADSAIGVEQTAGEKIIAEGQAKIDALNEQYLKDVANLQRALQEKKITQSEYNSEVGQLGGALGSSVTQISTNSAAKAQEADNLQQEKNADQLKEYLTTSADDTSKAIKGIKESETQKIVDEGNTQLAAITERYNKELDLLQQNLDAKKMSQEQYEADVAAVKQEYANASAANAQTTAIKITAANNQPLNSLVDQWSNVTKQMSSFAANTTTSIANGMAQLMLTGKLNVASFTQAILSDLMKIVIEKEIAGIVGSFMGGTTTGVDTNAAGPNLVGPPAPTGHAGGGTIQAGVPVPVGERGPELFVPNVGGNIISNPAMTAGGGMGDVHVTVTNNGTPQTAKVSKPVMNGKDMILQIMTDDLRTGGPISTGMQQKFGLTKKTYM